MFDVPILYSDDDILILDKPSGLVVDTTPSNVPMDFNIRSGIVHRLDKGTSGVMVVALNEDAYASLMSQFKRREVKKEYRTICLGHLHEDLIRVDAPIGRNPKLPRKFAVVSSGKASITDFAVLKRFESNNIPLTYVKALPKTGRTHQIRVHLASLGFPILGDSTYMSKKQFRDSAYIVDRMLLHAYRLSFKHPKSGDVVSFEAPLPYQFEQILNISQ